MPIYVVFAGHKTGIYDEWIACKKVTDKASENVFCKFDDYSQDVAAYEAFLLEKSWCSKNLVNACHSCKRLTKLKICIKKPNCGRHYYECTNAGCSQMPIWVADLMMRNPPEVNNEGTSTGCSQSSAVVSLQAQERDKAIAEGGSLSDFDELTKIAIEIEQEEKDILSCYYEGHLDWYDEDGNPVNSSDLRVLFVFKKCVTRTERSYNIMCVNV